ncbi:MAG: helix-turn-helix domain-containing protein [Clostridia bacterium]|nr:helix-turn-helix domain-containing protein [Clostridia bacterium]
MIEKRYIKLVSQSLAKLHTAIRLYDEMGECLIPAQEESILIPTGFKEGIPYELDDNLLVTLGGQPQMTLGISKDITGAQDILLVVSIMVENILKTSGTITDEWDLFRLALRGELSGSELEMLASEYQIPLLRNRCVMLLHVPRVGGSSAFALLNEVIPQSESDALVDMDRHTLALIKDMDGIDDSEGLRQFAEAVRETITTDTACQVVISVGTEKTALFAISDSYQEAKVALEVGRSYKPDESVYLYGKLIMERLLSDIPTELSASYHTLLFNRKTARLFNEEMLNTVDMFFKKDLNLSDTARQLYIHRNTLVYRLDKILRQTGLDLRKFDDAVTYKVLLELKRRGNDRTLTSRTLH